MLCVPARGGFFFDDQHAIKQGAEADGFTYKGEPVLPGFSRIRQAGEAISVLLLLENGEIAHGDCAAVQYSGAGGRDPLFLASDFIPIIEQVVTPLLEGRQITSFRQLAEEIDGLKVGNKPLHTAIRYGVTQAILDAVAKKERKLMVDVIAGEYGTKPASRPLPIFAQTGDDRYINAEKMIIKGVDVLPHGLINHVPTKLGFQGEILREYIKWLKKRVMELRTSPDYRPVLHIDVYGTIGMIFQNNLAKITSYLRLLEETAFPLPLRIEGPVDMGEREGQIRMLQALREELEKYGSKVEIVADEWCNTFDDIKLFVRERAGHMVQVKTPDLGGINNSIEAVLYCRKYGMGAYLGGTCNETDRSAQICTHVGMATGPDQILAKPGMGMDEGYMIVFNEMNRILALRGVKPGRNADG